MQNYAFMQKVELIDQMRRELVGVQGKLDRFSARFEGSSGAAKEDARIRLAAVRGKLTDATRQLDAAESATESTWDVVQTGCRKSYGELTDSFDKTRQWMSDKIEP